MKKNHKVLYITFDITKVFTEVNMKWFSTVETVNHSRERRKKYG